MPPSPAGTTARSSEYPPPHRVPSQHPRILGSQCERGGQGLARTMTDFSQVAKTRSHLKPKMHFTCFHLTGRFYVSCDFRITCLTASSTRCEGTASSELCSPSRTQPPAMLLGGLRWPLCIEMCSQLKCTLEFKALIQG